MADSLNIKLNIDPNIDNNKIAQAIKDLQKQLTSLMIDADTGKIKKKIAELYNLLSKNDKIKIDVDEANVSKLKSQFTGLANEIGQAEKATEQFEDEIDKLNKKKVNPKVDDGEYRDAMGRLRNANGKYIKDTEKMANDAKAGSKGIGSLSIGNIAAGAAIGTGAMLAVQGIKQVINIGSEYEKSLADFSAITGVQGEALQKFGNNARDLAKTFGGSAKDQIESFKGILSRLGPDIAKSPEALNKMALAVNTLSKASGMDAQTSMDSLTTSLLQFNVDLSNPQKAAEAMSKMMNTLGASAKEGAAEIPQVSEAIKVAGVAAYGANVSFEETNSAIQMLATGGKVGAEAGTALRNVIGLLQKQSGPGAAALKKMGLSSEQLGKTLTTKGLSAALQELQGGMSKLGSDAEKNQVLMTLFGQENSAAAGIMLRNADAMGEFTKKLSGTNTAVDQAKTNMKTTAMSFEKVKAQIQDLAIGLFQVLAPVLEPLINAITNDLMPALKPLFENIGGLLKDTLGIIVKDIFPILKPLIEIINSLLNKALAGILPLLKPIGNVALVLLEAFAPLVDVIAEFIQQSGKELAELLVELVPTIRVLAQIMGGTAVASMKLYVNTMGAMQKAYASTIKAVTGVVNAVLSFGTASESSAKSRLKEAEAEGKLLANQKKSVESRKKQREGILNLTRVYSDLVKKTNRTEQEQEKLRRTTATLNEQYPDLKLTLRGTASDLANVSSIADRTKQAIKGYADEIDKMSEKQRKNEKSQASLKVNVKTANLTKLSQDLAKDSDKAEKMVKKFLSDIWKSGNDKEVDYAIENFKNRIYGSKGIFGTEDISSSNAMLKISSEATKVAEERKNALVAYYGDKAISEEINTTTEAIKDQNTIIEDTPTPPTTNTSEETKEQKKLLDILKEKQSVLEKQIETELTKANTSAETARINQKRTKNEYDELAEYNREIEATKKKIATIKELFGATIDDEGKLISISPKLDLKSDEKENFVNDLQDQINGLLNSISETTNNISTVQIKLDDQNLEEKEAKWKDAFEGLVVSVDSDIAGFSELENMALTRIKDLKDKIGELKISLTSDKTSEAEKVGIEGQIKTYQKNIEDVQKSLNDSRVRQDEKALALFDERLSAEEDKLKASIERQKVLREILLGSAQGIMEKSVDKTYDSDVSALEAKKEAELITEEEYNSKKVALEEEHQKRLQNIRDFYAGAQLENQRQDDLKLLDSQKTAQEEKLAELEKQLAQAKATGDKGREESLTADINSTKNGITKLAQGIEEKGNLVALASDQISATVTETFANLFSGDEDALKAPWRKLFSIMAGALSKYVSAVATELVFGEVSKYAATGFTALFLIPAFQGLVSSALNAVMSPILNGLLSFATGGRVDEPTLAIVGDANQARRGSNTEWILRDDQLWLIVHKAVDKALRSYKPLEDVYRNFVEPISNSLKQFTNVVSTIKPYFKEQNVTISQMIDFLKEDIEIARLKNKYAFGDIDYDTYTKMREPIVYRINSYANGSPSLTTPEIAFVGDSPEPERVLTDSTLKSLLAEASGASHEEIMETNKLLRHLISVVDEKDYSISVDSIGQAANRYQNLSKKQRRGLPIT